VPATGDRFAPAVTSPTDTGSNTGWTQIGTTEVYAVTAFTAGTTMVSRAWAGPTTNGSSAQWEATWTTSRSYASFGVTFYDSSFGASGVLDLMA